MDYGNSLMRRGYTDWRYITVGITNECKCDSFVVVGSTFNTQSIAGKSLWIESDTYIHILT